MTDKRLIDANALMKNTGKIPQLRGITYGRMKKAVEETPTIDAVEVVHGRWEYSFGSYSTPKCSCCGWCIPYSEDSRLDARNYCPSCGEKMDGGAE